MYRCPRLVDGPVVVELPNVMYKMPVYNVKRGEITRVSPADKSCPDALILEARQEAVLRRLQTLKEQLDRLQSTRINTNATTTAAAAATPAVSVLGAVACSSPVKTQTHRSDLLRQQESVLYRLSLLKVRLGQLSVKEDEVKMEQPLTLAERHKGIVKVISTLREEILFFADLQKSMEEQNEPASDQEEKKKKEEEEEEEEEIEKQHRYVLLKLLKLKQELKILVDRIRESSEREEERDALLLSVCGCLDLPPLADDTSTPSAPSLHSSTPSLHPSSPSKPSLHPSISSSIHTSTFSSSPLPSPPSSSSSSSLSSLLPPPPPLPSSSSSSSCKVENDPSRPLQDLVISASPSSPPLSLVVVRRLLGQAGTPVHSSSRIHSSISQVSRELHEAFTESPMEVRTQHSFGFSVQWTDVCTPTLMISPLRQTKIAGEANILRYLSRLLPSTSPFHYEATGSYSAIAEVDLLLDVLEEQLVRGGGKERMTVVKMIGDRLVRSSFLCGSVCGLADLLAWSLLRQSGQVRSGQGQQEVVRWMAKMDAMTGLDLDCITNQQQQQRNKQTKTKTTTATAAAAVTVSSPSKGKKHFGRKELEEYLKKLGIQYKVREHKEVFTVEELMKQVQDLPGVVTKNLFLKDKKKKLYLLSTKHDTEIDLKTIAKKLGTKDLRLADESILLETLGVKQGSVSPLALANDASDHLVTFLIESSAIDPSSVPFIYFHPMCNASTLGLTPQDLNKFLAATGHSPTCVTLK